MQNQDSSNDISPTAATNTSPDSGARQAAYYQLEPLKTSRGRGIIKYGLIGGAIASWIDIIYTLLTTFVPAIGDIVAPLYQLSPSPALISVSAFLVSLLIALLCSPGFFVAGLLTTRSTGRISSAMAAWALSLACFAAIDLCLSIISVSYTATTMPYASTPNTLYFWGIILVGWFIDLIVMSIIGFGATMLGGKVGPKR